MDNLHHLYLLLTLGFLQAAAPQTCPANICRCRQIEIASRLETTVLCNVGSNEGYVPVFRTFSSTISSLYLSKIQLTTLGNESFRELSIVRELYLNDNYLIRIETKAFSVIDHTIERLDLQHNKLTDLQFLTTHNFSRLTDLLLRDNQLHSIDPVSLALLPALETLNLDDNRLTGSLPFLRHSSLKGLTHLNLDANLLTEINPTDFLYLTNLKSLLVNRNQLQDINFLNHTIFKQLQGIGAANNQLENVDPMLFADKTQMKWIDLSANKLTNASFLASCSLRKLKEIYLSSNQLESLPTNSFQATSSLSIFIVDNNMLQSLPRCALSRFYKQLQEFDISNNPMQCDCELSWLQQPHSIPSERQSECVNLEFTSTADYDIEFCTKFPPCVALDACSQGSDPVYGSFTGQLQQEYSYTTQFSNTAAVPQRHIAFLAIPLAFFYSICL